MKIAHIIPGSGGSFYCGNCLRDSKYMQALMNQNQEVIKVPLYLPIFDDAHDLNNIPVFYGAVSTYLKQRFPLFRHLPAFVDRLLNSRKMLHMASQSAGSTRAKGLEEMTVSMLLGEEGLQKDELEKLIHWLKTEAKPDIIHLSNALLLGLARRIKEELNVPVVCSLQDEDVWVDVMSEKHREESWQIMTKRGKEIDGFIAVSDYFAVKMKARLQIPDEKLYKNYIGVDSSNYTFRSAREKPPVIGYISRMCKENGLEVLVDAFIRMREEEKYSSVKLMITGGQTNDDIKFIRDLKRKLIVANLDSEVTWMKEFADEERMEFFKSISVLSVPVLNGEAFGLYQLEALASGVPIVQPNLGAFPEVVSLSKGGVTYFPNTSYNLSSAIKEFILDKDKIEEYSVNGLKGVKEHFDINTQAEKLVKIYNEVLSK